MKLHSLFFVMAFALALTAKAQITKGNWLVGGDAAFSYSKSKPGAYHDSKSYNINVAPNIGYFFWDKLAFGTRLDYRFQSGTTRSELFLISPFVRYYILDTDKMVNPFLESSYQIEIANSDNNTRLFTAKAGLAIFVNDIVAYEVSINYLNSTTNTKYIGSHTILLGIGIQVHLKKK